MKISVCIPCYRSAKTIPLVVEDIQKQFEGRDDEYQIILANDGSPDNTFEVITELCGEDERIIGVDLTRNYGQSSAKLAALQYADGDAVVFMDDDGQHPAEVIPRLVEKLGEGYDVVYARFPKKKASLFKRLTSWLHHWLSETMGNKPKGVHSSPYQIWSKPIADAVKKYHSPFISLGGYLMHVTSKYGEIDAEHKSRISGKSGYTLKKLFRMWKNIFFSFSMVPLQFATMVGGIASACGFLGVIYLIVHKIRHPSMPTGYTSTNIFILLIGGLIMFMIGVVGEYIGRIYMTISGMPQYNVRNVINAKSQCDE